MNTNSFKYNWDWQLQHIEQIKQILKKQAMHIVKIEIASPENDMQHATDLEIQIKGGSVAVRIRRDIPYRDITIRAKNGNSNTEIHKLREGYADWYLYAWTIENKIVEWALLDINIMRLNKLFDETRPIIMNKDGYTGFVTYSLPELNKIGAIVAVDLLVINKGINYGV